jgi:formate C-acetyltransferase
MYEFIKVEDRVRRYRERIRDRVIVADSEKAVLRAEAVEKYKDIIPLIKRPLIMKYLCENTSIEIFEDDYFAGTKSVHFAGSSGALWGAFIDENAGWTLREDGLIHSPEGDEPKLAILPEDVEKIRKAGMTSFKYDDGRWADSWLPAGAQEFFDLGVCNYGDPEMPGVMVIPSGHLTPGWPKIINMGYGAIRKQAQDFIDAHMGNVMGDNMRKYMFYQAVVIACDAAEILIRRYADLAREKAAEAKDPARRAELERMGGKLDHLATQPARDFWEACQAAWFYQLLLMYEQGIPGPAFGRFDQYTWPFLKKDLESGKLTEDQAQAFVDAFFLKANTMYEGGLGKMTQTTGIGNTYQHTTIGGVDPKTGEDATNPVTFMVLETVGRLKLHDPTISMRVNKDTPDELWECALMTSKLVGGLPLFQNDDVIIPGLMKELNFELKDARDYSIIGCQEIVGSGTDYPAPNGVGAAHATIYYGLALDMAINNGINPASGKQAPVRTGYLYEMNSIEEVREAYEKMTDYLLKWLVTINNYAEYLVGYNMPQPFLSISMEGCMEQGIDAVSGGCKYNSYGGTATGLATIADSLSTIKYMCFDKKLCTTRELYDAVMANWEGYDELRSRVIAEAPHYGNADPYVDEELKFVVDLYYKQCSECSSQRSKVYKAGMYGAADHIAQGEVTWATPDGRRTGEPIADAMSPAQGRDVNGPTAVFLSSCCFDHTKFMDGMALNLRMHPSVLSREDGIAKLRMMTQAYFENGGLECQYNVVDTETLHAAQSDPASYRDLVVRIAGYSAYFVELGKNLQDDIIARKENII